MNKASPTQVTTAQPISPRDGSRLSMTERARTAKTIPLRMIGCTTVRSPRFKASACKAERGRAQTSPHDPERTLQESAHHPTLGAGWS